MSIESQTPEKSQRDLIAAAGVSMIGEGFAFREIETPTQRAWRRFKKHRLAIFGALLLITMAVFAIGADFLAPYSFSEQDLTRYREGPSWQHLLGTDSYGRDVLSRLMYGGRVSLSVGLVAVAIMEAIAIVLGSLAGYYGGVVDWIIMRLVDIVMTFPWLIIVVILVTLLGPSVFNAMLAIGVLGWTIPTRLVRGQILAIREMDYVLAARCLGVQNRRIIFNHVLPGVVGPLVVNATFAVAGAILTEAGLSFLGLGVQPPTASWGNMMNAAMELIILEQMPWLWVPPGICVMLSVLAINFVGDGLRDALDPRGMLEKK